MIYSPCCPFEIILAVISLPICCLLVHFKITWFVCVCFVYLVWSLKALVDCDSLGPCWCITVNIWCNCLHEIVVDFEGLSDEDEGIERPSTVFTQTTNSTSALGEVTTDGHDVSHAAPDENGRTEHSSTVFAQTTRTTSTVGDLPTAGRTDSTTSASQTQSDCHFRSPLACCLFGHTEHCK